MNRPSYNPSGVCKNPIPIRLMDSERAAADDIAAKAGVSRAKVLREAIVAGLPIVREALIGTATPLSPVVSSSAVANSPATEFSSGEAPASPAGLSTTTA